MPHTPAVGRVVHIVTYEGHHRPAHIIDPQDGARLCVLAMVKPWDIINERGSHAGSVLWLLDDCPYDPTGTQPDSWHWPEYVPKPGETPL